MFLVFQMDTLKVKAHAYDPEGDELTYFWSSTGHNLIKIDDDTGEEMSYVCTTGDCQDTLKETTVVIDTLKLVVKDIYNDSSVVNIELIKGKIIKRRKQGI